MRGRCKYARDVVLQMPFSLLALERSFSLRWSAPRCIPRSFAVCFPLLYQTFLVDLEASTNLHEVGKRVTENSVTQGLRLTVGHDRFVTLMFLWTWRSQSSSFGCGTVVYLTIQWVDIGLNIQHRELERTAGGQGLKTGTQRRPLMVARLSPLSCPLCAQALCIQNVPQVGRSKHLYG